jgi:plastocyanin
MPITSGGSLPNEALMKRAELSRHGYVRLARLLSGLVAVLGVLAVVSACGSDSSGGTTPSASPAGSTGSGGAGDGSTVEIKNFMFSPMNLTVPAGTTVTWKFDDSTQHTANDNSFTSSPMANGQTFTHTFSATGTVAYHCSIHPFMTGTIVVK